MLSFWEERTQKSTLCVVRLALCSCWLVLCRSRCAVLVLTSPDSSWWTSLGILLLRLFPSCSSIHQFRFSSPELKDTSLFPGVGEAWDQMFGLRPSVFFLFVFSGGRTRNLNNTNIRRVFHKSSLNSPTFVWCSDPDLKYEICISVMYTYYTVRIISNVVNVWNVQLISGRSAFYNVSTQSFTATFSNWSFHLYWF